MKRKTILYPVSTLTAFESKINPNPDYQRAPAWKKKQKQLLMDTILREYDIPKIYLKSIDDNNYDFEVIDGQQRLRAIWEFCKGIFILADDIAPVNGKDVASKKYTDFDMDLRTSFDSYLIDVVIIEDAIKNEKEDEVGDMFLRLQNGTTLKAQEKRNAMQGKMKSFVKSISNHPFFENCKFTNVGYAFHHAAAQLICIEIAGGATNIKDIDLNKMYEENKDFDSRGEIAKKVKKVLDYLLKAFPNKTPELQRYNVINVYCIASMLIESYVWDGTETELAKWFIEFEEERRKEDELDEDDKSLKLLEYKELIGHSNISGVNIRSRLDLLEALFFTYKPDILQKDETRNFSHAQRLAIYRKGEVKCELKIKCDGEKKLPWDNNGWHADHIIPYSKGGKTIVSNGQVACPECNLAKSNRDS